MAAAALVSTQRLGESPAESARGESAGEHDIYNSVMTSFLERVFRGDNWRKGNGSVDTATFLRIVE